MFLAAREAARNHHIYYPYRRSIKPVKTLQVKVAGFARVDDLAAHYGVDLDTIAQLNPALCEAVFMGCQLVPKDYRLNLPLRKGVNIAMLASKFPRDKYRRSQQSAAFYRVRKGDTAGKISVKFGIPLSSLITVNSLDAKATIYVDQKLILPFAARATNLQGNRIRPIWMASKGR
jgi:membrane-bound lytic murein transglycosylase D